MTQGKSLSAKLAAGGLVRVMAAHSPLSARLAEEAGFDGLWASGFELSALYGLADMSLITMTQHLDMVRAVAEQSTLPVVADLDTGFDNAINVVHAVKNYERAGAAAVVIEDKRFPKVTSLAEAGRLGFGQDRGVPRKDRCRRVDAPHIRAAGDRAHRSPYCRTW